jgi:YVTN family beta-propeller protein
MMQTQFGEPAAPVSSVQVEEGISVGMAVEDEQLNRFMEELQQVCQSRASTFVVVVSVVQIEAAQWAAKLEVLSKQRMGSTKIISQTSCRIKEWFIQVNQIVESMKIQLQSMKADLVTFAGTDLIEVEDLLEAIAKVRKIVAQIDDCQAEMEVEQTAVIAERAEMAAIKAEVEMIEAGVQLKSTAMVVEEKKRAAKEAGKEAEESKWAKAAILATNHRLQVAVDELKQAYLEQMSTAIKMAKIVQEEATKWAVQVEKILRAHAEESEVLFRMQVRVQEWLIQVSRAWVVESVLEQSCTTSSDIMIVARVAQVVVQNTVEVIMKTKRIFAQIETYQAEMAAAKAAWVAGQVGEIAREEEIAAILARIEAKPKPEMEEKERAAREARKKANIKTEAAAKAKVAVERGKLKEKAVEKAIAVEKARRAAKAKIVGVYVLVRDDGNAIGNIIVINNETNKIMSTIPVGQYPCGVAVTPDGSKIYVANGGSDSNNIVVIDTATQQVKDTILVGQSSCSVAVTPDGSKIYVANGGSDSNSVIVIDTATQQVKNTIPVKQCPCGVVITPDGTQAYVWTREQTDYGRKDRGDMPFILQRCYDDIIVIDIATQQVISTIPVGKLPEDVAITFDGRRAYVANGGSDNVSVIDTVTQKVLATILVGRNPNGVAITLDGRRVYVANGGSDNVSVIDTATQKVLAIIPVGSYPNDVAVTPDGRKGYVANRDSNSVSVIDTAMQQVLATIPVGSSPRGIAIASIIPQ